jgi:DNA-binding SARP family transcriptional activator
MQLCFSILGPPRFTCDDKPLSIGRQQYRALLYRLAAQTEPVARDHLMFLFWPDMPDEHARRNLTQLLSHVRRLLPDPDLLLTTKEHVQLDPMRVRSDAVEFDRLCKMDDEASLCQAITLYRDVLLTGVSLPDHPEYEAWLSSERFRVEKRFVDALNRQVQRYRQAGRYREAAALAERYLAIDELAEEIHRQLMEIYAAAGDRSAALRQYERCIEVLERELGVEPLPETEAAYQAILAGGGATVALGSPPAFEPAGRPSYKPTWVTLPGAGVPLVGRDDLVRELAATFRRVQAGQGQVVLLRGEAGIGKSRLMQEFATSVQEQALVLAAACYPSTQSIPYQPIVEALRPVLGGAALVGTVAAAWLSEASILLPELRQLSPGLAPPVESTDPQQARGRLFEALRQIVLGLVNGSFPVMLCLDDLHWADTTTLDWLGYLARHAQRSAFMLLGTFRDEEADVLADLRRDLGRIGFRPERQIGGLEREFIGQLLVHLRVADARAMTERLHHVTGGNPFFLLETISELLESGLDAATAADRRALPISENVREAVQLRLERLLPLSRQLLEAGAVQEIAFGFDFIRKTAGRSELETADALDELVNRTLLVEEGDGFRFRHDLIRAAVYQGLSAWRRRLLHQRVAQVLEAEHAGQTGAVAVQLARHFQTGGQTAKAIFYWRQAGDVASRLYAQAEAIDAYRRGLELAKKSVWDEHLPSLFSSLGRALELASQFDQALATYVEMEATAVAIGSRTLELQALMAQTTLYSTNNPQQDLARGEAVSRKALELAKTVQDEAAEAKILGNLIILYSYAYRWEEAIKSGQRSIEIARRINLPEQLALSLNDLGGHIYEVSGQFTKAKEMLDEARGLWQALKNMNMLADNLATSAAIGVWEGDYRRALRVGQEALRMNQEIESLWGQSYSQYKLGSVHWERGRIDLALAVMENCLHLARLSGFGVPQVVTQADVAMLYAELGDMARATEAARLALMHGETQGLLLLPYALGALAQVQIGQGNLDEAAAILARAELDSDSAANNVYNAPAWVARALLSLQRQDYTRAVEEARRLGCHSVSAHRPTALLIEAQALLALAERSAAHACLVEARRAAEAIGSRRTLWRVLHLLGETHPERAEGERLLRRAKRLVCTIAGYIPSADLRAGFLATPEVRSLMDHCKDPGVLALV